MNESKFCREVKESLLALYPNSKFFKVHGGLYQTPGLGDLIGCINGKYIEIETKVIKHLPRRGDAVAIPNDLFTPNQVYSLNKTYKAGGIAMALVLIDTLKIIYRVYLRYLNSPISKNFLIKFIEENHSFIIKRTPDSPIKWENFRGKIF